MDFFEEMPSLGRRDLMNLRKGIDAGFRSFSRSYGEALENFFDPLLQFLIFFEKLLI
ncbi:MAG: proline/glycine betaine ABC transporter permease, partial [SAR324 cluster bacterium]|nr:proline/glycine betaine ABC transporter permease [SAR324 cluster bacterium]